MLLIALGEGPNRVTQNDNSLEEIGKELNSGAEIEFVSAKILESIWNSNWLTSSYNFRIAYGTTTNFDQFGLHQ